MEKKRKIHKYADMICGCLVLTLCGETYIPDEKGTRSTSDKYEVTCKKCLEKINNPD